MKNSRRQFLALLPAWAAAGCGGGDGQLSKTENLGSSAGSISTGGVSEIGGSGGSGTASAQAERFTAAQYIKLMGPGINIGQYFDDDAVRPIDSRLIDAIKVRGFKNVRIPVKWNGVSRSAGIRSDQLMRSVRESVDAALGANLFVVLNVHHERWVGSPYSETNLAEFRSLWQTILEEFSGHSQRLSFQVYNEPWEREITGGSGFSYREVDRLNATVQDLIRNQFNDSHRVIHFTCNAYNWIGSPIYQQLGSYDSGVAMTVHYYLPLNFTHGGINSAYRWQVSSGDRIARLVGSFDQLQQWSLNRRCPIYLGEFGVIHNDARHPKYRPDVIEFYRTVAHEAQLRGWAYSVWDDNGWYRLLNRETLSWDEDILSALQVRI